MKAMPYALALGFALACAAPAVADVRDACRQDVESYCKNVERGGGRIMHCLGEHRAQISPTCKMAVADRMLERRAERQPGQGAERRAENERRPGAPQITH